MSIKQRRLRPLQVKDGFAVTIGGHRLDILVPDLARIGAQLFGRLAEQQVPGAGHIRRRRPNCWVPPSSATRPRSSPPRGSTCSPDWYLLATLRQGYTPMDLSVEMAEAFAEYFHNVRRFAGLRSEPPRMIRGWRCPRLSFTACSSGFGQIMTARTALVCNLLRRGDRSQLPLAVAVRRRPRL